MPIVQPSDVIGFVAAASSEDAATRSMGLQALEQAKASDGYVQSLVQLISDRSQDTSYRLQAALLLKRFVDAIVLVKDNALQSERQLIRNVLVQVAFTIESPPLSNSFNSTISSILASVARYDWPRDWPELIQVIRAAIESHEPLVRTRGLQCANEILRTLQAKRTPPSRAAFSNLCESLLPSLITLQSTSIQALIQMLQSQTGAESKLLPCINLACLTIRCGKKLVLGAGKLESNASSKAYLTSILAMIQPTVTAFLASSSSSALHSAFAELLCRSFNAVNQIEATESLAFCAFLPAFVEASEFVLSYCSKSPQRYNPLISLALEFLCAVLDASKYRAKNAGKFSFDKGVSIDQNATSEATAIRLKVANREFLIRLCEMLIFQYFILTPSELNEWLHSAEEYAYESRYDMSQPRSLAENLFLYICRDHISELGEPLLTWMSQAMNAKLEVETLAPKSCVYAAFALAFPRIHPFISEKNISLNFSTQILPSICGEFDSIMQGLQSSDMGDRAQAEVFVSRVLLLIGSWNSDIQPASVKECFARILIVLRAPATHLTINAKLAASDALQEFASFLITDEERIVISHFKPFAPEIFEAILSIIDQCENLELQQKLLTLIGDLISALQADVVDSAQTLLRGLPGLWTQASNHQQLRSALLASFTELVRALAWRSDELMPFFAQVIREACTGDDTSVSFLEPYALHLWHVCLQSATFMSADFKQLVPLLGHILQKPHQDREDLVLILGILESTALLDPTVLNVQPVRDQLANTLVTLLQSLGDEGLLVLAPILESLVSCAAEAGLALVFPCLTSAISIILKASSRSDASVSPLVLNELLYLFARLMFERSREMLDWLLQQGGQPCLSQLVSIILQRLDTVAELYKKKLFALGLAVALASPQIQLETVQQALVPFLIAVDSLDMELQMNEADSIDPTCQAALSIPPAQRTETERRAILASRDAAAAVPLIINVSKSLEQIKQRDATMFNAAFAQVPAMIRESLEKSMVRAQQRMAAQ